LSSEDRNIEDISVCQCNNVLRKSTWFYIPAILRFRVIQIHAMLGEVSLDIVVRLYLVLYWIGEREAIGRS